MKRLISTLLMLAALPCLAADPVLVVRGGSSDAVSIPGSAGIRLVQPGTTSSAAQYTIPRYRTGASFPAGQILGYGPGSELKATSATHSLTPPVGFSYPAIVQTQGFGEDISQWQLTSSGKTVAVLQPELKDVTIEGYSTDFTAAGDVDAYPSASNQGDASKYYGVLLSGTAGRVERVHTFAIPGTALAVYRPHNPTGGRFMPHDQLRWTFRDNSACRVFTGWDIECTDFYLSHYECLAFRDYGLKIGTSGQYEGVHCWAGGYAGEPNGTGGAAIWVSGGHAQGSNCYGETAPIGLRMTGSDDSMVGFYSHDCTTCNVYIGGSNDTLMNADIVSAPIGIDVEAQYATVGGGTSIDVAASAVGIKLGNGQSQSIRANMVCLTSNGIGLDAHFGTLSNSNIDINVSGGALGADFNDAGTDRIGANNKIRIITKDATTSACDLSSNWTTSAAAAIGTSEVYINGTRWYQH